MFLRDVRSTPGRLAVPYPHPMRLGQVPSPAGFSSFLDYLAAAFGYTTAVNQGGAVGADTIGYLLSRSTQGPPEASGAFPPPIEEFKSLTAFQVSPYWAAWLAAGGTSTSPPPTTPPPGTTTPPPSITGADVAQITNVTLPSAAVPAGAQFTLQVTLLNVGTVTWSFWYTVILQAPPGTPTSAPQSFAALPAAVAPGQSVTVTLTAWAPTQPGTYAYTVGLYTPASQRVSTLVTAGLVVGPATAGSSVVPTTSAGYVTEHEFGTFVEAMLARQQQEVGAISGMQAGAASQYSPVYVGQPGPPQVTPVDQQAGAVPVVQAAMVPSGLLGLPWWLLLLGLALVGGAVYYRYGTPGRRRLARGATTVTVRPGQPAPRPRRAVRRSRR